ncbi:ATP-binding protein [Ilumatobacter sp.]|uniref:ATP-binding protein n=1 Tax=Ilumatobacter sp. TaxID=1967498 RepID=UPI003B52A3AA
MTPLASIRGRATLFATIVFAIASVAAAAGFVAILRTTMVQNLDSALQLRAGDLATLTAAGVTPREIAIPDDGRSFAQIVLGDRVVAASSNVRGRPPVDVVATGAETIVAVRETTGELVDFRVLAVGARSPSGPVRVVVGEALDDVDRTVRIAATALGVGAAAITALAGLTTWRVVRRSLRPVDSMRAELAEIGATELGRRVPVPTTDDEVRRLAATMNSMLDRLEVETRSQREFSSAASHELRTPITIVRHRLETAAASPAPDWEDVAAVVAAENERMQRLVDDLLLLARRDSGSPSRADDLVDLDDLVLSEAVRLAERTDPEVVIDVSAVSAGQVRGDAEQLRRVVRNLVENARRHARRRVAVSIVGDGCAVTFAVDDDGTGVPPAERERVFERFVRLDEARSRDGGGSGLGLSIVREVVAAHDGDVVIAASDELGGARVVVTLPDARGAR